MTTAATEDAMITAVEDTGIATTIADMAAVMTTAAEIAIATTATSDVVEATAMTGRRVARLRMWSVTAVTHRLGMPRLLVATTIVAATTKRASRAVRGRATFLTTDKARSQENCDFFQEKTMRLRHQDCYFRRTASACTTTFPSNWVRLAACVTSGSLAAANGEAIIMRQCNIFAL